MSILPGNFLEVEHEKRHKRCLEESFSISELVNGTFEVINRSHNPPTHYLVQAKKLAGKSIWAINCECPDFLNFCSKNFMKCKHMLAVEMTGNDKQESPKVVSFADKLLQKLLKTANIQELIADINDGIPETIKSLRETNMTLEEELESLESLFYDYSFKLEDVAYSTSRTERERKKKLHSLITECIEIQDIKHKTDHIRKEISANKAHCDYLTESLRQKCAMATLLGGIFSANSILNLRRGEKYEDTGRIVHGG